MVLAEEEGDSFEKISFICFLYSMLNSMSRLKVAALLGTKLAK
jgi:hypothetical protein